MTETESIQTVELLGLTHDGVSAFVHANVDGRQRKYVEQTLEKNPILLSVCAITFYCAALCQVLVDKDIMVHKLTTYTRITLYIMKVHPVLFKISLTSVDHS